MHVFWKGTASGMKKIAMFDLDGTLFDTRRVNYLAYQKALETYGIILDYDYFCRFCNGRHYTDFLPELVCGSGDVEQVHKEKKRHYIDFLGYSRENTALFSLIDCMRPEYHIALVTTASRKNCMELLSYHGREKIFELIISAEDVKEKKPDPEGYLKAMDAFGLSGKDAVVFEDSDAGILAAERSGAFVLSVKGYS